jgi:small conductance mechanosensitive channel
MEQSVEQQIDRQVETVSVLVDAAAEFVVAYGFQILGALVVLLIGIKIAAWAARKTVAFGERRGFDPTITKFAGNVVRVLVLAVVVVITLSNFGIAISPLVALAGAAAFGGTLAIQGPLSNYGAGISIILSRPFTVGNTIQVRGTHGVVQDISLAHTVLTGEDGERITIPNKEIVGQIIVNSHACRVVETRIAIGADQDVAAAIGAIRAAISERPTEEGAPSPQVGVHGFTYGGIVLGARFWVPSLKYFAERYAVNRAIVEALAGAGIPMLPAAGARVFASGPSLDAGGD